MSQAQKLKRCPFCHGKPKVVTSRLGDVQVYCHLCFARVSGKTIADATKKWNSRFITGKTSDGYHSFDELYYHRVVLSSIVFNSLSNLAWKSKLHHDGTMYANYFIVGIETPLGQATYHYALKHWDKFNVKELERAPEWDGHSSQESIKRILSINSLLTTLNKKEMEENNEAYEDSNQTLLE